MFFPSAWGGYIARKIICWFVTLSCFYFFKVSLSLFDYFLSYCCFIDFSLCLDFNKNNLFIHLKWYSSFPKWYNLLLSTCRLHLWDKQVNHRKGALAGHLDIGKASHWCCSNWANTNSGEQYKLCDCDLEVLVSAVPLTVRETDSRAPYHSSWTEVSTFWVFWN